MSDAPKKLSPLIIFSIVEQAKKENKKLSLMMYKVGGGLEIIILRNAHRYGKKEIAGKDLNEEHIKKYVNEVFSASIEED